MSEMKDPQPPLDDLVQIRKPAAPEAPAPAAPTPPDDDLPAAAAPPPPPAPPLPPSTMDDLGALATADADPAPRLPPPPVYTVPSTMGDLDALQRLHADFDDPNSPEEENQPRSTMDEPTPEDGERLKLLRAAARAVPPSPLEPLMLLDALLAQLRALHETDLDAEKLRAVADLVVQGSRMSLRGESDAAALGSALDTLVDALISARSRQAAAPEPSSMGDLFARLEAPDGADSDDEAPAAASSMGDLFAHLGTSTARERTAAPTSSMGDLSSLLEAGDGPAGDDRAPQAPSSMDDLFEILALLVAARQTEADGDESSGGGGGGGGSSMEALLASVRPVRSDSGASEDELTSSMGDLFAILEGALRDRAASGTGGSALTSSMGDLFALLGKGEDRAEQREEGRPAPSSMEDIFEILAAARAARAAAGESGDGSGGDGAPSSMEGLLAMLARGRAEGGGRGGSRAARLRSSLSEALRMAAAGRLAVLPERQPRRHAMADDMSKLLAQQEPRLQLPRRKERHHHPVVADGFTPIPPEEREVQTQLAPGQGCPKRGAVPVPAGELVHERLDFRYNRFERLVVRQTQFECPGCPDVALFVGQDPAFMCANTPLGDGLLAQLVVAVYRDRLPLQRFASLLGDLGAPIPQRALAEELGAVAGYLRPVFAEMLRVADQEEPPLLALVKGRERHTPGQVLVRRSKAGQVCLQFSAGEYLPPSPVAALAGPRALAHQRGQGRAGRWAEVRQRFLLALLTDPERARRGLALLERLGVDPHPGTRATELAAFLGWLREHDATFSAPRNRFEHAITATLALWPQLSADGDGPKRRLSEAPWTLDEDAPGPEAELLWLSLVESCGVLGVPLWGYLYDLLRARGSDARFDPRAWTPQARATQG